MRPARKWRLADAPVALCAVVFDLFTLPNGDGGRRRLNASIPELAHACAGVVLGDRTAHVTTANRVGGDGAGAGEGHIRRRRTALGRIYSTPTRVIHSTHGQCRCGCSY